MRRAVNNDGPTGRGEAGIAGRLPRRSVPRGADGATMKQKAAWLLVLVLLSGCTTIGTLSEDETRNKVYSGTIRQVELGCAHAVCLDFPFSLVADTLLLPITIPWTLVNLTRSSGDNPRATGGNPPDGGPQRDTRQAARPAS